MVSTATVRIYWNRGLGAGHQETVPSASGVERGAPGAYVVDERERAPGAGRRAPTAGVGGRRRGAGGGHGGVVWFGRGAGGMVWFGCGCVFESERVCAAGCGTGVVMSEVCRVPTI